MLLRSKDGLSYRARVEGPEGVQHLYSQWFNATTTAFGQTCETEYSFQVVNDDVKHERTISGCSGD